MIKGYYLKTCSTCNRILKELNMPKTDVELQNIKVDKITEGQLKQMKQISGSYESLFSRKSMQYRARKLNERELKENDYKNLILEEYTFLKRPVFITKDRIFIGNAKATIVELKEYLND